MSHSDDSLLWAIEPNRTAVEVTVIWPSGLREVFPGLPTLRASVLVEGRGQMTSPDTTPAVGP